MHAKRTTLTVIRHSLAVAAEPGADDNTRILSEDGHKFAGRRRDTLPGPFQLGIASDRRRAIETLEIVGKFPQDSKQIISSGEFYTPDTEQARVSIDNLYGRLGGGHTLREYISKSTAEEFGALREFATLRWNTLMEMVHKANVPNVLVVNHEVFAPMLLWIGCHRNSDMAPHLMDRPWGPCDGVQMQMVGDRIKDMVQLPALT